MSENSIYIGQRFISNEGRGPGRARLISFDDETITLEDEDDKSLINLPRKRFSRLEFGWRPTPELAPKIVDPVAVANSIVGSGEAFVSQDSAIFTFEAIQQAIETIIEDHRPLVLPPPASDAAGGTAPGEHAPVPTTEHGLLIEALRTANRMSGLLNELNAALFKIAGDDVDDARWAPLHDLLIRRFSDCSAVHLFIGADNIRLELPPDLRGEPDSEGDDE